MPAPNFMPPPDKQFYSLGIMCQNLQLLPPAVLTIAAEAGVEPHEWRDGVPVFRGDAVEKILDLRNRALAAIDQAQSRVRVAEHN